MFSGCGEVGFYLPLGFIINPDIYWSRNNWMSTN